MGQSYRALLSPLTYVHVGEAKMNESERSEETALAGPKGEALAPSKKRSFVQEVLMSRSPWTGGSDLQIANEHFEFIFPRYPLVG